MEAIAALSFSGTPELMEFELEPLGVRPTATEGEPFESIRRLHEDAGGEFGVWECQPGRFPVFKDGVSEFMCVLSGYARVHGAEALGRGRLGGSGYPRGGRVRVGGGGRDGGPRVGRVGAGVHGDERTGSERGVRAGTSAAILPHGRVRPCVRR